MTAVAFVTCSALPDLEDDDRLTFAPLAARGIDVTPAVWDDPEVDWSGFDLAVLRSTWDYPSRRDEFVAWAARVPRLANAAATVTWNTDKRYLAELAAAGVDVVPTEWVAPGDTWTAPADGVWVVKPSVGAGSREIGRYETSDPEQRNRAAEHVKRLAGTGRTVMVQPYLPAVDSAGETAMMYFGGRYSHAIRKGPMLSGPAEAVSGLYLPEVITPREPSPAERAVAEAVLAALPARLAPTLYARVDLIPGPDGRPVLIELELTEPSLFLAHEPGAADRFAAAVAAAI
jgi:glutathione synthase/RimK-type ligase-like ATP-grasp enzyme